MLTEYFRELDELKIETVFDPSEPFHLTSEGVKKAFNLIESHHTHGRVVFQIAKNYQVERLSQFLLFMDLF